MRQDKDSISEEERFILQLRSDSPYYSYNAHVGYYVPFPVVGKSLTC